MDTDNPIDQIKTAVTAYKRTKTAHEKAQTALAEAVVAALRAGKRPADVARASEWDREYNRRLKAKADREDALGLGMHREVEALSDRRIAQLDQWLREKRADWYADLESSVLTGAPEQFRQQIAVSRAVADGHIPTDSLRD